MFCTTFPRLIRDFAWPKAEFKTIKIKRVFLSHRIVNFEKRTPIMARLWSQAKLLAKNIYKHGQRENILCSYTVFSTKPYQSPRKQRWQFCFLKLCSRSEFYQKNCENQTCCQMLLYNLRTDCTSQEKYCFSVYQSPQGSAKNVFTVFLCCPGPAGKAGKIKHVCLWHFITIYVHRFLLWGGARGYTLFSCP